MTRRAAARPSPSGASAGSADGGAYLDQEEVPHARGGRGHGPWGPCVVGSRRAAPRPFPAVSPYRATARWTVVIPQKDLCRAKTRIALGVAERRHLALAMLEDTITAVLACHTVEHVVVVCDNSDDASRIEWLDIVAHVPSTRPGHNAAVEAGASLAQRQLSAVNVAVLPGDLPALRPRDLRDALGVAAGHPRAFVRDAMGRGTTLLTATAGAELRASYGESSATAHELSGAVQLGATEELLSLRHDVDDMQSLHRAVDMGCGVSTRRFYSALTWADSARSAAFHKASSDQTVAATMRPVRGEELWGL
jgi:2-phospho-L-lactate guanylyltransferase